MSSATSVRVGIACWHVPITQCPDCCSAAQPIHPVLFRKCASRHARLGVHPSIHPPTIYPGRLACGRPYSFRVTPYMHSTCIRGASICIPVASAQNRAGPCFTLAVGLWAPACTALSRTCHDARCVHLGPGLVLGPWGCLPAMADCSADHPMH